MLANELVNKLKLLIDVHGDCPVFCENYGSYETNEIDSIEAITQEKFENEYPKTSYLVPPGTTYFWIK
jgi:hypothetical protein